VAFVLTTDPIIAINDAKSVLGISEDRDAIILINSLSAKFKRFTNRVQINQNIVADIVEKIIPYGGDRLYLHAPIWTGSGFTISAAVYDGGDVADTYTFAAGEIAYMTDDMSSEILLLGALWPDEGLNGHIQVTYKGGWPVVPGDVVQGAILQGRMDLLRTTGEVGVTSRGRAGETTSYQSAGLIQEVRDLWAPYRMYA
jgi:hypothetical protein